jgi:hypothetical protein
MKTTVLCLLLLFAMWSWAGPRPDQYPIKIHVVSSRWVVEPAIDGPQALQRLTVTIGGSKKYELEAPVSKANLQAGVAILALGDYKAKLVSDEHKSEYEFSRVYEFLFPDQHTRRFTVVGQFE